MILHTLLHRARSLFLIVPSHLSYRVSPYEYIYEYINNNLLPQLPRSPSSHII